MKQYKKYNTIYTLDLEGKDHKYIFFSKKDALDFLIYATINTFKLENEKSNLFRYSGLSADYYFESCKRPPNITMVNYVYGGIANIKKISAQDYIDLMVKDQEQFITINHEKLLKILTNEERMC